MNGDCSMPIIGIEPTDLDTIYDTGRLVHTYVYEIGAAVDSEWYYRKK